MPSALSADLRERVVAAIEEGVSRRVSNSGQTTTRAVTDRIESSRVSAAAVM